MKLAVLVLLFACAVAQQQKSDEAAAAAAKSGLEAKAIEDAGTSKNVGDEERPQRQRPPPGGAGFGGILSGKTLFASFCG